ncbi:MAG: hypothetical protein HY301_07385 [Verrucomicrobia bacterium]|nr:hypothetical protein [Verrucomicrobiota bacterium]
MNPVFTGALALQTVCRQHGWRFCFIGGVAVQRWSEPRFTEDADLTLLSGFGREEEFIRPLIEAFRPRIPEAAEFALRNRVLLLRDPHGTNLDVALGALPFEIHAVGRASEFEFPGGPRLVTCGAEDLLVHKCFAARQKDWLDVEGILRRQHGKLDLALVRRELKPLVRLKEMPEILTEFERKVAASERPFRHQQLKGRKRRT